MSRDTLDRLVREPRRAVGWVQDHLPDVGQGRREVVEWVQAHLPHARVPEPPRISRRGPDALALILPSLVAAAGAGAAFWAWTAWSRGRAEAEREAGAVAEGVAHPEEIMAHAPPPDVAPVESANPSDAELEVPAEEVMAHAPPEEGPGPKSKVRKVKPVVAPVAKAALDGSLAVQASADGAGSPSEAPT